MLLVAYASVSATAPFGSCFESTDSEPASCCLYGPTHLLGHHQNHSATDHHPGIHPWAMDSNYYDSGAHFGIYLYYIGQFKYTEHYPHVNSNLHESNIDPEQTYCRIWALWVPKLVQSIQLCQKTNHT